MENLKTTKKFAREIYHQYGRIEYELDEKQEKLALVKWIEGNTLPSCNVVLQDNILNHIFGTKKEFWIYIPHIQTLFINGQIRCFNNETNSQFRIDYGNIDKLKMILYVSEEETDIPYLLSIESEVFKIFYDLEKYSFSISEVLGKTL